MSFPSGDQAQRSFSDVDDNALRIGSSLMNPMMLDPNTYLPLNLGGVNMGNGNGGVGLGLNLNTLGSNTPTNADLDLAMLQQTQQQIFQQIQNSHFNQSFLPGQLFDPNIISMLNSLNNPNAMNGVNASANLTNSFPFDLNFDPSLITGVSQLTQPQQDLTTTRSSISSSHPKPKRPKVESGVLRCTCHNTNCLKRYCVCFKAGRLCTKDCACGSCKNCPGNEEEVREAVEKAKDAHPNAFIVKSESNRPGCKCKRECRKNYCECRRNGFGCFSACNCVNCQNGKPNGNNMGMNMNMNMNLFQLDNIHPFSTTLNNIIVQQAQNSQGQNTITDDSAEADSDDQSRRNMKRVRDDDDGEDEEFDTHINEASLTLRRPSTRKRRSQKLNDDYYVDPNVISANQQMIDPLSAQDQANEAEVITQMIPQMVQQIPVQEHERTSHYDPAQDKGYDSTDNVYSNGQYKLPHEPLTGQLSVQSIDKPLSENE